MAPLRPSRTAHAHLALLFAVVVTAAALAGCTGSQGAEAGVLRLGYFPNLTHAPALYGIETGLFDREMGDVELKTTWFNAGPTAMEALLTDQIDVTYVGPSPTINAIATSGSGYVKIIAGAASAGARFIVQPNLNFTNDEDYGGKTFASPQLGNTQDVSLRDYLASRGHQTKDRGGDVQIINPANPEILALFTKGDIAGAWVPEPWATRLEVDGGGKELLDERSLWPDGQFVTTHVVTTRAFLRDHPETVKRFLDAHVNATLASQKGDAAVLAAVNAGIKNATGSSLREDLLARAYPEVTFTYDPLATSFVEFADKAEQLGFVRGGLGAPSASYDLEPLNDILKARGLNPVGQP